MKTKTITNLVAVGTKTPSLLERDVDSWLQENPNIEIVTIQYSTFAVPRSQKYSAFGSALIIYKENS